MFNFMAVKEQQDIQSSVPAASQQQNDDPFQAQDISNEDLVPQKQEEPVEQEPEFEEILESREIIEDRIFVIKSRMIDFTVK